MIRPYFFEGVLGNTPTCQSYRYRTINTNFVRARINGLDLTTIRSNATYMIYLNTARLISVSLNTQNWVRTGPRQIIQAYNVRLEL